MMTLMDIKLPATWTAATLGAVAHGFLSGGTPSTKNEAFWRGSVPWITSKWLKARIYLDSGEKFISEDAVRQSATTVVPRNNLIFATRVGVGKVSVNRLDLAINQDLAGVLIDPNRYDIRFLAYQLRSERIQNVVASHKRGATIQGITRDNLKELEINLPPLPEQRKIAGVLGVVQRAIEQQERLLALTAELKKTLLHKLFTEGLRGEPQKQTEIGPMPESWKVVPLGSLATKISKGSSPGWQGFEYVAEGVVFVRSQNVGDGRMDFSDRVFLSPKFNEQDKRSILKNEDILINLVGASIGRVALGTPEIEGANCNQAVGFVRMDCQRSFKEFLIAFLLSPVGQQQMIFQKKDIARANLSLLDLKTFKVPVPPTAESEKIAEIFVQLEAKLAINQRKHAVLTDLFRTLLHQLMTAQIRVHDLDLDILECGDVSPLSEDATRRADQSADPSAHSERQSAVVPAHSKRGRA